MERFALTGIMQPSTFELEQGFNTLGRNPTNDFRVHDATVSSFHCEIVLSEDSVLVRDLGSTNGTFIDGKRVEEDSLRAGQILRLGSAELRLEKRTEPETARITIPKASVEQLPTPNTLADGYPACLNHSEVHASHRCVRCQKDFCSECVSVLRLAGGIMRVFCPSCSAQCESLPLPPGAQTIPPKKKEQSLLGRLTQTIRIRFK
jgi:pSer/pThr/pTyr-binding forkhead associated (FHA) protein